MEDDKYRYQTDITFNKYAGIQVSHTHNDAQWSTLNVRNIAELKQLRDAINNYIKGSE